MWYTPETRRLSFGTRTKASHMSNAQKHFVFWVLMVAAVVPHLAFYHWKTSAEQTTRDTICGIVIPLACLALGVYLAIGWKLFSKGEKK